MVDKFRHFCKKCKRIWGHATCMLTDPLAGDKADCSECKPKHKRTGTFSVYADEDEFTTYVRYERWKAGVR